VHIETDVAVLGAGVCGLAAASVLGDRALVLEGQDRPGGLVRTECFDGYWFDRVLHLLHFRDDETQRRIQDLVGDVLHRCPPDASIVTEHGRARFPLQMNLSGLHPETVVRCVRDFAAASFGGTDLAPDDYETLLLETFGQGLCETFFFPYNRKLWQRPLSELAPGGFVWNIQRPDFTDVLRGALGLGSKEQAYNVNAWYPRPPPDAPVRGMEVLSQALAGQVQNLLLGHRVEALDPQNQLVRVANKAGSMEVRYREGCLSTLPMPMALQMCSGVPQSLLDDCRKLTWNRVRSVMFALRGPRPEGVDAWTYYTDESLAFTRLIHTCQFDPRCAPPGGWGLMAEIPEPGEQPLQQIDAFIQRVTDDVLRCGAVPDGCEILHAHVLDASPAYVVFSRENHQVMGDVRGWLDEAGISCLGRYGRWEYSSMAQVMRDGFEWAEAFLARDEAR
jgi:protoporphyrinogen oxidase